MKRLIYVCVALLVISGVGNDLGAQYLPERRAVRKGNRQFERHNYKNSIDRYVEALDADSTCYEALYNLGNAYYQANLHRDKNPNNSFHWRDADSIFERIGYDTLLGRERRAEALRNLGESRLTQQRFEEALKALKESLKLNPSDAETKYDYMLAKCPLSSTSSGSSNRINRIRIRIRIRTKIGTAAVAATAADRTTATTTTTTRAIIKMTTIRAAATSPMITSPTKISPMTKMTATERATSPMTVATTTVTGMTIRTTVTATAGTTASVIAAARAPRGRRAA